MAEPVGPMDCWGTTWLIVTGASRGLGAGICEAFAAQMAGDSLILGIARSKDGLDETAAKVKSRNSNVQFIGISKDLTTCSSSELEKILEDSLRLSRGKSFHRVMLVHNAGSLGKLDYLKTLDDMSYVRQYFDFNLSSVIPLTTLFLRSARSMEPVPKTHIINISSLCAVQAMKSWGLYCTAKAGRDMIFKVLAKEEESVQVLNYAPGPLDNEMQAEARAKTSDPEVQSLFQGLKTKNQLVQVPDTSQKLAEIIKEGKYTSGDHVDYFD